LLFTAFPLLPAVFVALVPSARSAPALAATVFNVTNPVSFSTGNPCNGELVTVSGSVHNTFRLTFDGSGGVHVGFHANFQDVIGVGSFGNKYQIPLAANEEINARVGLEETITLSEPLVSQGSTPNFITKEDIHFTVNPNGTVTSFRDNFRQVCRG
jgi:hypothetical protein